MADQTKSLEKRALENLYASFEDKLNLNNDLRELIGADGTKMENSPRAAIVNKFAEEWENNWTLLDIRMRRAILRQAALKLFAETIERIQTEY